MLGYFFFFITLAFYVGLALLTASRPNLAGDNAMGYGLGLVFLGSGFAISSLLLTITGIAKGGFNWLAQDTGLRVSLALAAWLFIALTTFFCAVFKWEWYSDTEYPEFLRWLSLSQGQLWIPLLWLGVCFLSLNAGWQTSVSPNAFKIPFWAGLGISGVFSAGLLIGYIRESEKTRAAVLAEQIATQDEWHQINLDEIAAHRPEDPVIWLLSFSNRMRPDDIRMAATAKITSRPDWEAEILELLNDQRTYREVYYFLDGNAVEHPERFAGPLNNSILWLAETIRKSIKDANNLQSWSYDMYGIEALLRAIDAQFMNQGVDFYPNVVQLSQALHTTPPERFEGVRFTVTGIVDNWLKTHKNNR